MTEHPFDTELDVPDRVILNDISDRTFGSSVDYQYKMKLKNTTQNLVISDYGGSDEGQLSLPTTDYSFSTMSELQNHVSSLFRILDYEHVLFVPVTLTGFSLLVWGSSETTIWNDFYTTDTSPQSLFSLFDRDDWITTPNSQLQPKTFYGCVFDPELEEHLFAFSNCIISVNKNETRQKIWPSPNKQYIVKTVLDVLEDGGKLLQTTDALENEFVVHTI